MKLLIVALALFAGLEAARVVMESGDIDPNLPESVSTII